MAVIYADPNGLILRFLQTPQEEAQYGAPVGTSFTIEFDASTNADTVATLCSDWNSFSAPGGVLARNGTPVTINAPSTDFLIREAVVQLLAVFGSATPPGAPTQQQIQDLLAGTATLSDQGAVLSFVAGALASVWYQLMQKGIL